MHRLRHAKGALLSVALLMTVALADDARAAHFSLLHRFDGSNGRKPYGTPVEDKSGNLYGTTFGELFEVPGKHCPKSCGNGYALLQAGGDVIYSFRGKNGVAPPSHPAAALIMDKAGRLYGTSQFGGEFDNGTVFSIDPVSQKVKVLYSFTGGSDGAVPVAPLILDKAGNLFGTTTGNPTSNGGNVFELSPPADKGGAWSETVLHTFPASPNGPDGYFPAGKLLLDGSGNLFGTTFDGGVGLGTVFEVSPPASPGDPWTETVIYRFTGNFGDAGPTSGLIADANGSLYGTSEGLSQGGGTVFQLSRSQQTWTMTPLYSFCSLANCRDGIDPRTPSGLAFDAARDLYGTTYSGGAFNYGTLFRLSPSRGKTNCQIWCLSVLHDFANGRRDGANPNDGVAFDPSTGVIYGETEAGGSDDFHYSLGTVYQYTP